MKKRLIIFLFLGLILWVSKGLLFAAEIAADSRIAQVTVYPDSALLSRVAELKLTAGEHKIVFSDIIPEVDENSLRVSVGDNTAVKLFGAQLKKEFLEEVPSGKVKQLKDEIEKIKDELTGLQNLKSVLSDEKKFLDSIQLFSTGQIPKDLVTRMPVAKDLEDTLKFLDVKLRENSSQAMEAELKTRELSKKLDVLNRELSEILGPGRKLKRSIIVELEALKPGSLDLMVSYLVRGANWQPIYDARADFEKSEVDLVSYGIVKQRTGEDWQGVEISLSTAKPAVGGRMPDAEPWVLRPLQPRRYEGYSLAGSMDRFGGKEAMLETKIAKEKVAEEVTAPAYSEVQEKGIAVVYKLPNKATIKSDGSEHKLPISAQMLKAKFEYSTYPRAVLNAYLGSRVSNAPELQLLAGRVNIFLSGDFVGASSIDNIGPGEEFDLYLGLDENVKVKREQIEKKVDETLIGGIPSPTKRTIFKYKLTVENYKSKKINLKLLEAMPVSEDERIKVKIEKISLEPKQKDWKDRKGVWLWELELEPKAKQEITYNFIAEHPRQMQVEGL